MNRSTSWLDGQLSVNPQVSTTNRGFLVGVGVFETLKVSEGHVEFLERHLRRLGDAWKQLGFDELDLESVRAGVNLVIEANPEHQKLGRLRITVTEDSQNSSILVTSNVIGPPPAEATCALLPWVRNESSPLVGIKSTSYADNVLALNWAKSHGFTEGIYLNTRGHVSEGTTTNIFVARNGEIFTPPLSSGLLPGIVREVILENRWAQEIELTLADLETAEEIFVTSSIRGVQPVGRFEEREFAHVGVMTQELIDRYRTLET